MYKELECYRHLPEQTVISVSGGRTSAYLLAHILEANGGLPPGTIACFQNTGLELPATLDFVHNLETHFNVPITWLERDKACPQQLKIVNHNSAAREGQPFIELFTETVSRRRDGTSGLRPLPYPNRRVCTSELKIKLLHRYVRKVLGWRGEYFNVLGFRYDEERRVERRLLSDLTNQNGLSCVGLYPMYSAEVESEDVYAFWDAMPFDLEIPSNEGNCDFCFMKSAWKVKAMMQKYPERVGRWIALEEAQRDRNNVFRKDRPTMRQMFEEVRAGNMCAAETDLFCGTCTD